MEESIFDTVITDTDEPYAFDYIVNSILPHEDQDKIYDIEIYCENHNKPDFDDQSDRIHKGLVDSIRASKDEDKPLVLLEHSEKECKYSNYDK